MEKNISNRKNNNVIFVLSSLVILCIMIVVFVRYYGTNLPHEKYYSDEGDYLFAVSKGFTSNYLDNNSISLFSFIQYGFQYGFSKEMITTLSNIARSDGGDDFYRHYHVPIFFYYLILGKHFIIDDELSFRWLSADILIACAVIVCILLLLFRETSWDSIGFYFAAGMILFSPALFDTVAFISPHMTYALFTGIVLLLTARMIKNRKPVSWYIVIVCLALATVSVEYAPLLIITFVLSVYINRKELFPGWRKKEYYVYGGKSISIYILTILIVWPAGILKLSLIKSYLFFAYWATVRGGNYGTQNFIEVWLNRFKLSPVEFSAIFLSIIIAIIVIKKNKWLFPLIAYCAFDFLVTIRNTSPSSSHIASFIVSGIILSGVVLNVLLSGTKKIKLMIATLVLSLNCLSYSYLYLPPFRLRYELLTKQLNDIVEYVKINNNENYLVHRECLMTLHYYFPEKKMDSFRLSSEIDGFINKGNRYTRVIYWGLEREKTIEKLIAEYNVCQKNDIIYFALRVPEKEKN